MIKNLKFLTNGEGDEVRMWHPDFKTFLNTAVFRKKKKLTSFFRRGNKVLFFLKTSLFIFSVLIFIIYCVDMQCFMVQHLPAYWFIRYHCFSVKHFGDFSGFWKGQDK